MTPLGNVQKLSAGRKLNEQERLDYAKQVRIVRGMRGLSQSDLAEAAGVGRGTIINIETGKTIPQGDVLVRIMRVLGMVDNETPDMPDWVEGNMEIIASMLMRVPESKRAEVLSSIFTAIIQATPSKL